MENKQLALSPLSKETIEMTPQEVIELLLCLLSRVEELGCRLNKHSGNSDKPPSSDSPFQKCDERSPPRNQSASGLASAKNCFSQRERFRCFRNDALAAESVSRVSSLFIHIKFLNCRYESSLGSLLPGLLFVFFRPRQLAATFQPQGV
jgi:hypothetical protein